MLKNKNNFFLGLIAGCFLGILFLPAITFFASPVLAQVAIGNYGATFGLGTADLVSTVIKIVQWVLGFLGLIAVIMIMYGGFIWMTAGGNVEKVKKAKQIITRAVIGLIIVLLAWAIVLFIHNMVNKATGGPGGGCIPASMSGCWECNAAGTGYTIYHSEIPGCGMGGDTFRVRWVDPSDGETNVPLCSIVQAVFNGKILVASVANNAHLSVDGGAAGGADCTATGNGGCASGVCQANVCQGEEVAGNWQVSPDQTTLEFLPSNDYLQNTTYRAVLDAAPGGIEEDSASPRTFIGKTWWFTTGNTTLDVPPAVTAIYPSDGETDICLNTAIQSIFSSKMRVSSININTVKFRDLTIPADRDLRTPFSYPNPKSFSTRPAELMTAGDEYSVTLISGNTGNNDPNNGIMDVCLNHLDGDFNTNEDNSPQDDYMPPADPASPWNFFADTDTTNTQCLPEITGINPSNGKYDDPAPGVNIVGSNFTLVGNVYFHNGIIDLGNCFNATDFPNQNCVTSWAGNSINIRVPGGPINYGDIIPSNGAADGGVTVDVSGDLSNAWNFDVTSPQIKKTSGLNDQPHGGIGQYVTLIKRSDSNAGFGNVAGRVFFRRLSNGAEVQADVPPDPPCESTWTDKYVIIKVPDLSGIGVPACAGAWTTCVGGASEVGIQLEKSDGSRSNIINFIYTNEPQGPGLCAITPQTCGTGGDARTLSGENFGSANPANRVNFTLAPNPPVNANITAWADQNINITVPDLANSDEPYEVNATKNVSGTDYTSNALPFEVPCGGVPKVVEDSACRSECAIAGNECTSDLQCPNAGDSCVVSTTPSPNPYKGDSDVCTNAIMETRFTTTMDNTTLVAANIYLEECTDNTLSCTAPAVAASTITTFLPPGNDRFQLTPTLTLTPDRYYRMTIKRDVESENHVKMNSDYQWVFKTKSDAGPCPVQSIKVNPTSVTFVTEPFTQAYSAWPLGPKCNLLDPVPYTWSWLSSNINVATVTAGGAPNDHLADANSALLPQKNSTYIRATTEGKTGSGVLTYNPDSCAFDQTKCTDPLRGGCGNSVCNLALDRCTPSVTGLSPAIGPKDTTVTINGCWFDTFEAGKSKVIFGLTKEAAITCNNYWTNNQIIVKNPLDPSGIPPDPTGFYLVSVTTRRGLVSIPNLPADSYELVNACCNDFRCSNAPAQVCYSSADCPQPGGSCNDCFGYTNVPANGMPGLCPPIDPSTAAQGELVSINHDSYNLNPANGNNTDDYVRFNREQDDYRNNGPDNILGRGGVWQNDQITRIKVSDNTESGPVKVYVDVCPSNALDFKVRCDRDSDCAGSTGCCRDTNVPPDGIKECVNAAFCASPNPGERCLLPANQPFGACLAGVSPDKLGSSYRCIDSGGHLANTPPPTRGYPPAAQDNCRVCCDPDQDNDDNTADDPMTLLSGLKCTPNVSPCDGAGNERGLYCGCTNDAQCGAPTTIGCGSGNTQCCLGRPGITEPTAPGPDQTGVCLNTAIKVNFNQVLDSGSLNSDNVVVYSAVGAPLSRAGNSYNACSDNGNPCFPANPLSCTGSSGGDASSCTGNAEWTYNNIPFPSDDNYLIYVKSGNNDPPFNGVVDLAPLGVYHVMEIYLDGELTPRTVIKNLASQFNNPANNYQYGLGSLGSVTSGNHAVRVRWINDWCAPAPGGCDDGDSNVMINGIGIIRGDVVPGRIQSAGNGFAVYPSANLASNTEYQVFVRGGARADSSAVPSPTINNNLGIRSNRGVFMWDASTSAEDISNINRLWKFTTGADVCKLDHIDLSMAHWENSIPKFIDDPGPDLFFCAADTGCEEDYDLFCALPQSGNQHYYMANLMDKAGNPIDPQPFDFSWSDSAPYGAVEISDLCTPVPPPPEFAKFVTSLANNGEERITVSAVDNNVNPPDYGSATVSARAIVNLCENPWPDLLAGVQFPFSDDTTTHMATDPAPYMNFQTFYCRDNGNSILPAIKYNDAAFPDQQPIIKVNTPSDPMKDELIKEFFFMVDTEKEDAIGIRVMENQDNLSPELWFKKQFGPAAPKVEKTTVNSYQAVKQGRTVYVAAANLVEGCADVCQGPGTCCNNGIFYTNIYLISYNDNATDETVEIYKRLLANWTFNTNVTGDLEAFKRDLRRINDLKDIYFSLLSYKTNQSDTFPKLAGGTYLNYMSTSVWPSWQDTLGQELDRSLPVDPLNTIFGCPYCMNTAASFSTDQSTGSVEVDKEGNVYFTKKEVGQAGALLKCDSNLITCKTIRTYAVDLFPAGLDVDKNNGNILIGVRNTTSVNDGRIEILDKDGNELNIYTGPVAGDYPYRNVVDIETDYQGNYFVSFGNGTFPTGIHRFSDLSQAPTTLNFTIGFPDYAIAAGLTIDTNNKVYIAIRRNPSAAQGGNQIRIYNNELTALQDSFGDGNEQNDADSISTPQEIDLDNNGHLFVSEHIHDRVVMMDTDLKQKLNTFGEYDVESADKYHYRNPLGVRYDNGYLFVADSSNLRLLKQKIDLDQCKACWNEITKTYQCNEGSHIYQYGVTSDGSISNLYAALEYTGPGNWINGSFTDCPDPSSCMCFNYQHVVTGSSLDYDAPLVTFNNPLNNDIVNGNWPVQVTVTDPSGNDITKVEFFVDGVKQFTDNDIAGGWTWTWDTTKFADRIAPDPPHILKGVAYDEYGNFGSGSINVFINNLSGDNIPPNIVITEPIDGATISGTAVKFEAHASDASPIATMSLYLDGNPLVTTQPCVWPNATPCVAYIDTTMRDYGQHILRAEATAPPGPSGSAQITVTIDNGDIYNPIVNFTYPPVGSTPVAGSTISGNQTITAEAFDCPVGENCVAGRCNITTTMACSNITKIEFYLDGNLQATDPVAPYEWLWQTVLSSNTTHTVSVWAYDAKGNIGQASIQVTVRNGVTEPLIISFVTPPTPLANSSVSGSNVNIEAEASQGNMVRAQFMLNGVFQFTDSVAPFVWAWNTTLVVDGTYRVQVIGYDADGNPSPAIDRTFITSNGSSNTVPPVISNTNINPLSGQCNVTTFTITAQITDDGPGVDTNTTIAHIQRPDEVDVATVLLVDMGGGIFQGTFLPTPPLCIIGLDYVFWVDITACDLRGNCTEKNNI